MIHFHHDAVQKNRTCRSKMVPLPFYGTPILKDYSFLRLLLLQSVKVCKTMFLTFPTMSTFCLVLDEFGPAPCYSSLKLILLELFLIQH